MNDSYYMAHAIRLAEKGLFTTRPNPNVGCVIVKDDKVVGEGFHYRAGEPHAEIHALKQAGSNAAGATVYVTLEPCSHTGRTPPCANALVDARVARVVVAMTDPNPKVSGQGINRLREAGIDVTEGVLVSPAERINRGFIKRMQTDRPYVRVKLAMSLDGRTAMASGESKWITGADARADVHRMRAMSGAVITGSGTVLADDPSMSFRPDQFPRLSNEIPADAMQPLRVIVDSRLQTPSSARILVDSELALVATVTGNPGAKQFEQAGHTIIEFEPDNGKVPLKQLLHELAAREINDVMVEAGAGLAGAMLDVQQVDELVIYMAPHLMGDEGRGLLTLSGVKQMQDRISLKITDIRALGDDWRITALPLYP